MGIMCLKISLTLSIKKKMIKDKISIILTSAKGSNVLNAKILDIFKLNAQVFQGNKEE